MQDELINLDDLTELQDASVFKIEMETERSYERDLETIQDIRIEMNRDLTRIVREGYTVLDWISDVGGMQGLLIKMFALFMAFWNFN